VDAIMQRALFEGRIKARGLVRPVIPELYNIILAEMEQLGVRFVERVRSSVDCLAYSA